MAAPDRRAIVKQVVIGLAHHTRVSAAAFEDRRRQFLPHIIAAMPPEDAGNWGVLLKTDKNPDYIPSDILVWKPTMEHIDVLTGDKMPDGFMVVVPMWKNHGVIGQTGGTRNKVGKWVWLDVRTANIPPLERVEPPAPPRPPAPPPPNGGDDTRGRDFDVAVAKILNGLDSIKAGAHELVQLAERFDFAGVRDPK